MTRGTDFNMCPPTGGLRNYRKGYEDGLNRGKAELAEVLEKISAEIRRMDYHTVDCDVLVDQEEVLDIIEKYKAESEVSKYVL